MAEKNQPWQRQPDENDRAWEAFVRFRDSIPPRRIASIRGLIPIAELYECANRYRWLDRAAAYDAHIDSIRLQEREAAVRAGEKAYTARMLQTAHEAAQLIDLEIQKYLAASKEGDGFGLLKPGELAKLTEVFTKVERLYRGQATDIVAQKADLSKLTDEELVTYAALVRKIS